MAKGKNRCIDCGTFVKLGTNICTKCFEKVQQKNKLTETQKRLDRSNANAQKKQAQVFKLERSVEAAKSFGRGLAFVCLIVGFVIGLLFAGPVFAEEIAATQTTNDWVKVDSLELQGSIQAFYNIVIGESYNSAITPLAYSLGNHQQLRSDWQADNQNRSLQRDKLVFDKNMSIIGHIVIWTGMTSQSVTQK